jgi:predicted ATP-grasp superfamily ATP-dependent carboligase
VAHDADGLAAAVAAIVGDRLIVQERVGGELGAIAGVAWCGELVCAVHQRAARISPPEAGISALARTVPRDAALEAGVARFVALLGWSGVFQLQFVHAGDRAYAIDFNPRLYGSLALAIAAGANLPAVWVDLLLGRAPRPAAYRAGVIYRSEEKELQAFLLALGRRDFRTVLDVARPRRGATHAAFARDDPAPLLGSLRKALGAYGSFRQTDSATSAHSSSRGRVESRRRTPRRAWWRR